MLWNAVFMRWSNSFAISIPSFNCSICCAFLLYSSICCACRAVKSDISAFIRSLTAFCLCTSALTPESLSKPSERLKLTFSSSFLRSERLVLIPLSSSLRSEIMLSFSLYSFSSWSMILLLFCNNFFLKLLYLLSLFYRDFHSFSLSSFTESSFSLLSM